MEGVRITQSVDQKFVALLNLGLRQKLWYLCFFEYRKKIGRF